MHELFDKNKKGDISKLNLLQLADWIKQCRNAMKPDEDNRTDNIAAFCDEWEKHSENYVAVYNSELYQQALLANAIEPDKFILDILGEKYDVSDVMQDLTISYDDSFHNIKSEINDYSQKRINDVEKYQNEVQKSLSAENYREEIKQLVLNRKRHKINTVKVLKNEKKLLSKDTKRLLTNIEKYDRYMEDCVFSKEEKQLSSKDNRKNRKSGLQIYFLKDVQADLDNFNIRKQQYFYYFENKLIKEYDKKLFSNLAFYLSLDLNNAEWLHNINGYTIIRSREQSDEILKKCFRLGFPLLYATVLLERNAEVTTTLTARAFPNRKPEINIIDFENDACESKEFLIQLQYAINRVSTFLSYKHASIEGHKNKIAGHKKDISTFEKEKITLSEEISALDKNIAYYQANLKGNKQRLKDDIGKKRIKERRIASIDKLIAKKEESITLHENAIKEIQTQKYKAVEFLKIEMTIYDDYTLKDIEYFQKELLGIQLKYDKAKRQTIK